MSPTAGSEERARATASVIAAAWRWRTRRDGKGRVFHIRPDGTLVLPVGAREPDFTDDDMISAARARAAALRPDADAA